MSPDAVPVVFKKSNLSPAERVTESLTVTLRSPISRILPSAVAMY